MCGTLHKKEGGGGCWVEINTDIGDITYGCYDDKCEETKYLGNLPLKYLKPPLLLKEKFNQQDEMNQQQIQQNNDINNRKIDGIKN